MLKFDFYESGHGETTIITFPDNGIGIIDAYPSQSNSRPDILKLIENKIIHFICLTHPHDDHAKDLATITNPSADACVPVLWHTITDIHQWAYYSTEFNVFPAGSMQNAIKRIRKETAMTTIKLFENIAHRNINTHKLRNDLVAKNIAGVEIYCLSPTEKVQQKFISKEVRSKNRFPDPNKLSAILAFHYGKTVFIHGGDALKSNWFDAAEKFFSLHIPNATIIKIPHHGSANSFSFKKTKHQHNYLDLCDANKAIKSILFAGDSTHPNEAVYQELLKNSTVYCTANGLKTADSDPLNIGFSIPGCQYISNSNICNPMISFECDQLGNINVISGHDCSACS